MDFSIIDNELSIPSSSYGAKEKGSFGNSFIKPNPKIVFLFESQSILKTTTKPQISIFYAK
jgi:hypothetical protein